MKKLRYFAFFLLTIPGMYAQQINNYKYIIVPKKFEALKDTNQFQLNVLTRLLFNEAGFTAVYEDELPDDLQRNNCLGLRAALEKNSGIFTTKLKIRLQDCKNNPVFTSTEGSSRKKDHREGHQEALRNTFKSIAALHYTYTPVAQEQPEKSVEYPVTPPPATAGSGVLYAQAVAGGFQLVDSTPKVVYLIRPTGLQEVYIIKGRDGILYKKGESWIIEYYNEQELVRETVTVKF